MDRGIVAGVAYRVVACVAAIIVLEVVLGKGGLLSDFLRLDLSPLLHPLQFACSLLFASSILNLVLAGELADTLVSDVKILAFGLFFYILLSEPSVPSELSPLGSYVLACSAIAISKRTVDAALSSYNVEHFKPVSTCVSMFLAGYFSSMLLRAFSRYIVEPLSSIDVIVFYSFMIVSALSILGFLAHSTNPYASYFGRIFANPSSLFGLFALSTLTLIYFFNLRPVLLKAFPEYVSPAEWAAICLSALAAFTRAKSYVSRELSEPPRFGEWRRHIQRIVFRKEDLEDVSGAVSRFIDEGVKDGVIVYLTSILLRNGVPYSEIERVIRRIVGYKDIPPPKLTLAFSLQSLKERNRSRRAQALTSALREAAAILRLPEPLVSVGGEQSEDGEV